jgi:hypothetical protein
MNLDKEYLNTYEAEYYINNVKGLQTTANTLRTLVTRGGGPKFHKWGRAVRYTKQTIDDWVAGRMSELKDNSLDKGGHNA